MAQTNINWKSCSMGVVFGLGGAVVCVVLSMAATGKGEFLGYIPFVFFVASMVGTLIGTIIYPSR